MSANEETTGDKIDTVINLPGFLLALKQIASSPLPPETIKTLLASIIFEESEPRKYQDIIRTLKSLTEDARTGQDFKTIKLLLAQISINSETNTHKQRVTDDRNEHKRAADSCTDEVPSTSKKSRSDEGNESAAYTEKVEEKERHTSSRGRNSDRNEEANQRNRAISSLNERETDNPASKTETACDTTKRSYQHIPSNRKRVASNGMGTSNNNAEIPASNSHEVNQSTPTTSKGRNDSGLLDCDLCDVVLLGRVKLNSHYRTKHELTDPDQILFVNGKPLFATSNMFTNGGKAQWFIEEKEKALKRYKENPWICRLCGVPLGDNVLLEIHYTKHHKVDKMGNIEQLFKQTQTAAHLAEIPTSNPRKPRKPSKSKSDKGTQNAQGFTPNCSEVISISDDESDQDNTTPYALQSIKTDTDDGNGSCAKESSEFDIDIKDIKTEFEY